jgi:P27 family predicted phage terminase small subunit
MPDNVRMLTGNRGKRSAGNNAGVVSPAIEIPDCPTHLSAEAKKEWKRVAPVLLKIRIITQLDRAALAAYCQAYARWVEAEQRIKELNDAGKKNGTKGAGLYDLTPNGFKQMSVWLQISNRATEQMHRWIAEFGMTPANRVKIQQAQVPEQGDIFPDDKPNPGRFFGGK